MLGFYSVTSGMEIHIVDNDPFSLSRNGGLTDVSLVQKFKLSDEAYDQRKGTMRDYIREQRAKDPNFNLKSAKPSGGLSSGVVKPSSDSDAATTTITIPGIETVEGIKLGDRCEVTPGARRGVVQFVGEVPNLSAGYWVSYSTKLSIIMKLFLIACD